MQLVGICFRHAVMQLCFTVYIKNEIFFFSWHFDWPLTNLVVIVLVVSHGLLSAFLLREIICTLRLLEDLHGDFFLLVRSSSSRCSSRSLYSLGNFRNSRKTIYNVQASPLKAKSQQTKLIDITNISFSRWYYMYMYTVC